MMAADTSTWIAYFEGADAPDTALLDRALSDRQILMLPVVLAELISDPKLPSEVTEMLLDLPMVELQPGYWYRAGLLRAKVIGKRRKARLGDALIAQSCIDRDLSLITRDHDFRAFSEAAGLRIVLSL